MAAISFVIVFKIHFRPSNVLIWAIAQEFVAELAKVNSHKRWSISRSAIDENLKIVYSVEASQHRVEIKTFNFTVRIGFNIEESKVMKYVRTDDIL